MNYLSLLGVSAVLTIAVSFPLAGCGAGAGEPERLNLIDPADLDPDALVFAVSRGGGMARGVSDEFYWSHHPDFMVYVFGDRRVIKLDTGTVQTLGYRGFREGTVPEDTFLELLSLAAAVSPDDEGEYQRCVTMDGPSEAMYVGLPGLEVKASCSSSFVLSPWCEGTLDEWETPPPDALAALFAALEPLADLATQPVNTDRITLGAVNATDTYFNCNAQNSAEWPFLAPELPADLSEEKLWTTTVEAPAATAVRDFVRANLDKDEPYELGACVSQGGLFYRVFYDDMLPVEEGFPF